jgi:predicted transcriptional regulator
VSSLEEKRRVMNEDRPDPIIAQALMVTSVPSLSPEDDLEEALRALSEVELEELPVWDAQRDEVAGLISHEQRPRTCVERMAFLRRACGSETS